MIYSLDKYNFKNTNPDELFKVISDFNTYQYWWPKFISFENINKTNDIIKSCVYVSPFLSPGFLWEITNLIDDEIIEIMYVSGAYTGKGIWEIKHHNEITELTYEVNLIISNVFINIISKFISIEAMHKKLMLTVFKNLETYLKDNK
jgi:ribosome-associated toxin RatA of RatAB toxin-antitoxin module